MRITLYLEVCCISPNKSALPSSSSPFRKTLNPFPHDKILDQTKLKAFADDKLNVTKMVISVFHRVENIEGKGEIACTSNFSFSHIVFQRLLSQMCQKVSLCGNGLNHNNLMNISISN